MLSISSKYLCHKLLKYEICPHQTCSHLLFTVNINSLRPSDTIWRHQSGSTLAQVMAPSYYLNQCWLIINGVLWNSPYNNFTGSAWDISSWYEFENDNFEITSTSPRGQWVKPNIDLVASGNAILPSIFREWAASRGNPDDDEEKARERQERDEQREKNQRKRLIMNEFKKRRNGVRLLFKNHEHVWLLKFTKFYK